MQGAQLRLEDMLGVIIPITLFIVLLYWRDIRDRLQAARLRYYPRGRVVMSREADFEDEYEPEPEPPRSLDIPHMNHVEPPVRGSLNPAELRLNADEVAAVSRMIEHNKTAAKPSKSSTIQAGFGVSRGGSQLYQRASAIYDAFFGMPAPAVPSALFVQDDGTLAPPTYPVSGRSLRSRVSR
jgi:hypothetical protein